MYNSIHTLLTYSTHTYKRARMDALEFCNADVLRIRFNSLYFSNSIILIIRIADEMSFVRDGGGHRDAPLSIRTNHYHSLHRLPHLPKRVRIIHPRADLVVLERVESQPVEEHG